MADDEAMRIAGNKLTAEMVFRQGLRGSAWDRFVRNFTKAGPDECWQWTGRPSSRGYGRIRTPFSPSTMAHHVALVASGRDIPDGCIVDHICRNPLCVNPKHLRAVSQRINSIENNSGPTAINAAKTHCLRGHEFTPANTYVKKGSRLCRICHKRHMRTYYVRKKEAALQNEGTGE